MDSKLSIFEVALDSQQARTAAIEQDLANIRSVNADLSEKVERFQKALKMKNIIIFNLDEREEKGWEGLKEYVSEFSRSMLKLPLDFNRIDAVYRIGPKKIKPPSSPLLYHVRG